MGGKLHLRLNIGERPIANKYREGKMKRSLKRELKVLEIAKREANKPNHFVGRISPSGLSWLLSVSYAHQVPMAAREGSLLLASVTINLACGRKLQGRWLSSLLESVIARSHTTRWIEVLNCSV